MQLPDPSLSNNAEVINWVLMVLVTGVCGASGWFLKRVADAIDRMASAQEKAIAFFASIEAKLGAHGDQLEVYGQKIDTAISIARENVEISRLWKATEAPDRTVRTPPRQA